MTECTSLSLFFAISACKLANLTWFPIHEAFHVTITEKEYTGCFCTADIFYRHIHKN
jgi:hypothetical protein